MILSPIQRNHLDYALRMNGYHVEYELEGWVAADATFAPGRCFLTYAEIGSDQVIVATSLSHVARTYAEEGNIASPGIQPPAGAVAAFTTDLSNLHGTVRRIYELSRSLPSAPLDRFHSKCRALPETTEAERLDIQRIGQHIFREALMDFWAGRCAITGVDQQEMLRASHMKPWSQCATDAERLDPYNGLLLSAHWDAAFDSGLVTFEDDGGLRISTKLSLSARSLLNLGIRLHLRTPHLPFLKHHREYIWQP